MWWWRCSCKRKFDGHEKFILISLALHSRNFDSGFTDVLCWRKYRSLDVGCLCFYLQAFDRQVALGSERHEKQERLLVVEISVLVAWLYERPLFQVTLWPCRKMWTWKVYITSCCLNICLGFDLYLLYGNICIEDYVFCRNMQYYRRDNIVILFKSTYFGW